MALLDRLTGTVPGPEDDNPKLGIDLFMSSLTELALGEVTKPQIVAYFELNAAEEADLNWVIGEYNSQPNAAAKDKFISVLRNILIMGEERVTGYITDAQIKARIQRI